MGRKSSFSTAKARELLKHITEGGTVRSFKAVNQSTIFRWLEARPAFREQYARACELRADAWLEEIIQIADDGTNDTYLDDDGRVRTDHDVINRSRLRVDTRKWAMSKAQPKKYGDIKENDLGEEKSPTITIMYSNDPTPQRVLDLEVKSDK